MDRTKVEGGGREHRTAAPDKDFFVGRRVTGGTRAVSVRAGRDPGPLLWLLTGLAWLVMVALMLVPGGMLAMPPMTVGGLLDQTVALPLALAAFTGGWLVMMAAMMLPTTVPVARTFTIASAGQDSPGAVRAVFFGAYFAVWLAFGAVGLGAALLVQQLLTGARPGLVLAGALALAGVVQFSPLTKRCLTVCRDPRVLLFAHYRRGLRGAWALGLRHALACLGCCWALVLVMFATGVGGLLWMLGLTAVMVAEKVTRWGHRIAVPVGIVLLLAAAVLAVTAASAGGPPDQMQMQLP